MKVQRSGWKTFKPALLLEWPAIYDQQEGLP